MMKNRTNKSENPVMAWQDRLFSRSIRRNRKLAHIEALLGRTASLTCLEISAGDSVITRRLRASSGNWHTVVCSEAAATSLKNGASIEPQQINSEQLPFEAHTFDIVVLVDTLRTFENTYGFIQECHRVLKSDGQVVITDRTNCWLGVAPLLQLLFGLAPTAMGCVRNGFSSTELYRLLKDGFDIPETFFFNNDLHETVCTIGAGMEKLRLGAPCWLVGPNALQQSNANSVQFIKTLFYPLQWVASKMEFLPRHQLIIKSKRRIWRERKQVVIKDGRSIAEAAINTKIGTDAPF